MGLDQCCSDVYVGYVVGRKGQVEGSSPFIYVDILVRDDFIGFHRHQHAATKRCFEQGFYTFTRVITRLVELDLDMSFVVDVKRIVVSTPAAIAVKIPAHITVGARYRHPQLVVPWRTGYKGIFCVLPADAAGT